MPVLNPSFEEAGALSGEAAHWSLTAVTSIEAIAGFGSTPEQAWEDFERWYELFADFAGVSSARAFFDLAANGYEAFDRGWGTGGYLFELQSAQIVPAPFSADDVEDCETGWRNATFYWTWNGVPAATAAFDGEPHEDFDEQWRSNQSYAWDWPSISSSTAMFDGGAQGVEDFENAWPHTTTL